jgi:phosphonoacetate hydrolase
MIQAIVSSRIPDTTIDVNGRTYAAPKRPSVVILVDGFDPAYLEHGIANGTLPTMKSFREKGFMAIANCSMPGTTNTNNTSVVTGVPPVVHGINGNYYLDSETGEEVMITDAKRLRCGTILGVLSQVGVKTAVVTAKDKLLKVLTYEMEGINFARPVLRGSGVVRPRCGREAAVRRASGPHVPLDLRLYPTQPNMPATPR